MPVAVRRDRTRPHELHHEVGPARVGRAPASNTFAMSRMVHQRQRLPLGLEPGDDLRRVHARLDDLQRHAAAERVGLLGQPDLAHAAFADPLEQTVRTESQAW